MISITMEHSKILEGKIFLKALLMDSLKSKDPSLLAVLDWLSLYLSMQYIGITGKVYKINFLVEYAHKCPIFPAQLDGSSYGLHVLYVCFLKV